MSTFRLFEKNKNDKNYILFDEIPSGFKDGEKLSLLIYELSGIQTFIFGDTNMYSTREQIHAKSKYISVMTDKLYEWICSKFNKWADIRVFSKSSGKLICGISKRVKEAKIVEISDEIQRTIFASTQGKLEMHYAFTKACITCDKRKAKDSNAMSELSYLLSQNKYHCTNLLNFNMSDYYDQNLSIDEIVSVAEDGNTLEQDGVWVAIKLDLDNLGDFFGQIYEFDFKRRASEALAGILENAFQNVEGVLPIFIGGDDIFAIARIDCYLEAVSQIYHNIKDGIWNSADLELYREHLGISGGCSLVRMDLGRIPLIYYFNDVERQLEKAKGREGKNVLVIQGKLLSWRQVNVLARILFYKKKQLFAKLDENQRMILLSNILELKQRIIRMDKYEADLFGDEEEKKIVYSIN